jgi:hypothetical protein
MTREWGGRVRLVLVVVDQGLASIAWYMPVLLVGRTVAPSAFGVFLVGFGALAASLALSRAMFGVVVGMDADGRPTDQRTASLRLSAGGVLTVGAVTSTALLLASLLVPFAAVPLALLGAAAVIVLLQDLARYTAVAVGRPGAAVAADLAWCLPPLVALALDVAGVLDLGAHGGLVVWLTALLASLTVAAAAGLMSRPQFVGLWSWWRGDARRRDLGGDSLLSGVVPVANGWGAALVGGAVAVAAVRGAAMLFAPVMMMMLVMTLAAVPEARRRSADGARRLLLWLTGALTAAAACWGMVVLTLPDAVGRGLVGESWEVARPVILWVCVEYVGVALWSGGAAMLRYGSATRPILWLRLAYAPAAIVLPVLLLAIDDDPRTFAAVLALLAWLVGPASVVLGLREVRVSGASVAGGMG